MVKTKLNLTYTPDDWQIHLIIRILRGYDSIFLAGTGYGKSLIFEAVTALRGRKKVTIIICPLKALEADQVRVIGQSRFRILHMD
jgi:superfamily II DNA helicase RecQ